MVVNREAARQRKERMVETILRVCSLFAPCIDVS